MNLRDALPRAIRHAAHTLLRARVFSLVTVLTLALGLGAATAMFTLLDRVALRPLPYSTGARLVHVGTRWPKLKGNPEYALSRAQYFYFKTHATSLANLGLWEGYYVVLGGDGGARAAERVNALLTSASLFDVLGLHAVIGRLYRPDDELPRSPRVAVLSHEFWQRRFGGDAGIVGKRIPFDGDSAMEVVGVLQAGARLPDMAPAIWLPLHLDPTERAVNNHTHNAIARAKAGVSVQAVAADLVRLQQQLQDEHPDVYSRAFLEQTGLRLSVSSLRDFVLGETVARALWILFASAAVVLVIAAGNVANLFLVRMDSRRREVAVRSALGAGRAHLALQFLSESLILASASALAAIILATELLHLGVSLAPAAIPRLSEVHLGGVGIAFCVLAALAAGVVFGALPLGDTAVDVALLREGGRGMTTGRQRGALRRTLVVAQVALAVVLLVGAGLMVRSFARLRTLSPGFDPVGVTTLELFLPENRYPGQTAKSAFLQQVERRLEGIPGVSSVGAISDLPLTGWGCSGVIIDNALHSTERAACTDEENVTPGYFAAMRTPIEPGGHEATWGELNGGIGPVVVSRAFADRFWPNESPVGHRMWYGNRQTPPYRVVGVAGDVHGDGLQHPVNQVVYFPTQPPPGTPVDMFTGSNVMSLVVRAPTVNAQRVGSAVRGIVAELDPQVPVASVQPLEAIVAASTAQLGFTMLLVALAAVMALLLSAVGLYGVIAYIVAERRAEIGVRMALGAAAVEVSGMIVRQTLAMAAAGLVIGLAAAFGATRVMRALLFDVSPTDPLVFVLVAVVLLAIAVVASAGPARSAARVDPLEAMRAS